MGNLILEGLYNGYNLTEIFKDALMSSGDQIITGNYTVKQLTAGNMSGDVKDLDFNNEVIFLDQQANITGTKVFLSTVSFGSLNVPGTINGIQLKEFAEDILYLNQDANITGKIRFIENINIFGDMNVQGLLNSLNISELYRTTLQKNSNQTVFVETHFNNAIFLADVNATILLENLDIFSLNENAIYKCLGPNRNISSSVNFTTIKSQGDILVNNLNIKGNINGININSLKNDAVTLSGNHTIVGSVQITGDANATDVTAQIINRLHFPEDFVLLQDNQTISGYKIFADDVFVHGDFNMENFKKVNSVDLSDFAQNIVTLDGNETIISEVEFEENIIIMSNLNTSLVNSVEIDSISLMVQNLNQLVNGKKVFTNIQTEKDIVSENLINGYNLSQVSEETVLTGRKNQISGRKTIHGNITIQGKFFEFPHLCFKL